MYIAYVKNKLNRMHLKRQIWIYTIDHYIRNGRGINVYQMLRKINELI